MRPLGGHRFADKAIDRSCVELLVQRRAMYLICPGEVLFLRTLSPCLHLFMWYCSRWTTYFLHCLGGAIRCSAAPATWLNLLHTDPLSMKIFTGMAGHGWSLYGVVCTWKCSTAVSCCSSHTLPVFRSFSQRPPWKDRPGHPLPLGSAWRQLWTGAWPDLQVDGRPKPWWTPHPHPLIQ